MRLPSRLSAAAVTTLALSWGLVGCSGSPAPNGPAATTVDGIRRLDVDAFATLIGAPSTILLDIRTPAEYESGHLSDAQLVDFEAADFDARLATLDKQATYAIYCRSGNRSGQALERMKAAGFTHVADLEHGINAWKQAGHPVVTG
jgi:phage shock protein E